MVKQLLLLLLVSSDALRCAALSSVALRGRADERIAQVRKAPKMPIAARMATYLKKLRGK